MEGAKVLEVLPIPKSNCVVCNKTLEREHWDGQEVIAVHDHGNWIMCCVSCATSDMEKACQAMARRIAALRMAGN